MTLAALALSILAAVAFALLWRKERRASASMGRCLSQERENFKAVAMDLENVQCELDVIHKRRHEGGVKAAQTRKANAVAARSTNGEGDKTT